MPVKTRKKSRVRKVVKAKCEKCGKTYEKKTALMCGACRIKMQIERQREMYSSPYATSPYVTKGEYYYKNKKK